MLQIKKIMDFTKKIEFYFFIDFRQCSLILKMIVSSKNVYEIQKLFTNSKRNPKFQKNVSLKIVHDFQKQVCKHILNVI
mgnify:CR=1 FL=1